MAGGTRYRPRRDRGVAACVLTLVILSGVSWSLGVGLHDSPPRSDHSHQVTRRPAAFTIGTVHSAGTHDHDHGSRHAGSPTHVGTVTGNPPHHPGRPTSGLPQTSGAAATLLLSALAILALSAAFRVASAADRRERYHPRHRRRT